MRRIKSAPRHRQRRRIPTVAPPGGDKPTRAPAVSAPHSVQKPQAATRKIRGRHLHRHHLPGHQPLRDRPVDPPHHPRQLMAIGQAQPPGMRPQRSHQNGLMTERAGRHHRGHLWRARRQNASLAQGPDSSGVPDKRVNPGQAKRRPAPLERVRFSILTMAGRAGNHPKSPGWAQPKNE
jgi:hypothetical protein